MKFIASGDTGLTIQLAKTVDQATNRRVHALARSVSGAGLPGVTDVVPAYISLVVHFDPLKISRGDLVREVMELGDNIDSDNQPGSRDVILPVCFKDQDRAPDLPHLAQWAGLKQEEIIADITGTNLFVYMLGFAPGQPYLGDLPKRLTIPRRADPVPNVPKGSVLVADGKMVVYPFDNPTGWHVIGQTPLNLFAPDEAEPTYFRPGDRVRIKAIDVAEFTALKDKAAGGQLVQYHGGLE